MRKATFIIVLFFTISLCAQHKKAYQLFDKNGKKVSFEKVVKKAKESDVVLFGEFHDNPIAHWLQLALVKELQPQVNLILGAEMLERNDQEVVNQYLKGGVTEKALDTLARLWTNYKTDYKPLVDFAKEHQLPFIATNVPRKYARLVNKKGLKALDTLPEAEKRWIAPLPIVFDENLSQYKKMTESLPNHKGKENIIKAQAVKDATMADAIVKNRKPNSVSVHFNGTYHSDFYEGIYWFLKREEPKLKVITIATTEQVDLSKLAKEAYGQADFILVVDEDMTKTL
ncbi:ChaN family lipoprotein [Capnocytophaga ochracea]|jgi:hypothetical protein|uniref:ChaN family lipoprotein n=1 Tax=Capnocytophaga ochracea TaxID=1018 RepID=UPI002B45FE8A|nr:ChaN family lipoprotein [Capnocytophaga ochracea]MEB3016475.1 ChaN family lipoprotein [Capnocytophaga ochracea]MEB3036221.1 ChaN family lipoprotein [Capnocytophaga ochracea]